MVQPERRLARNDRQAVPREMRLRMGKAGRVVPHLAGVGDLPAQRSGRVVQGAVGERVGTVEQGGGPGPVRRPVRPHLFVAAVQTAGGQHHHRRRQAPLAPAGLVPRHGTGQQTAGRFQRGHAMAAEQRQAVAAARGLHRLDHAQRQGARSAPEDVVARHRIALAPAPPLDPVHRRHEPQAVLSGQPVVDIRAAALDVVRGPATRPVFGLGQLAEAQPVGQRPTGRIRNLHAPLQRRVHQRHAAEGPARQAPQALGRVAVHHRDAAAGLQAFERGHQTGQAAADDQHVAGPHLFAHVASPRRVSPAMAANAASPGPTIAAFSVPREARS